MKTYKQLSHEERDELAILWARGLPLGEIARIMNRNKSTLSRELRRNQSPILHVYMPNKAHTRAQKRRSAASQRDRLRQPMIQQYVIAKLRQGWSPEIIAGRISQDLPGCSVSHEAIYQFVYALRTRKEYNLVPHLVRAHKRRHRFGHSHHHSRSHIPNRTPIDQRPAAVENRLQPGHWEVDTVTSRESKVALVVCLERSSRMLHISKLLGKRSRLLVSAVARQLHHYPAHLRRTITYDNGSENVDHDRLNAILGTRSYFCRPFHSWEKGSIEQAIGLIRYFLPKKTDFAIISPVYIAHLEQVLNSRPRKCLGFKTPSEVFSISVALHC